MAESVESRVEAGAQALNEAKSTNNLDEKNETQEEKEEQNEGKKEVFFTCFTRFHTLQHPLLLSRVKPLIIKI